MPRRLWADVLRTQTEVDVVVGNVLNDWSGCMYRHDAIGERLTVRKLARSVTACDVYESKEAY
jgi:hypothetical protein